MLVNLNLNLNRRSKDACRCIPVISCLTPKLPSNNFTAPSSWAPVPLAPGKISKPYLKRWQCMKYGQLSIGSIPLRNFARRMHHRRQPLSVQAQVPSVLLTAARLNIPKRLMRVHVAIRTSPPRLVMVRGPLSTLALAKVDQAMELPPPELSWAQTANNLRLFLC